MEAKEEKRRMLIAGIDPDVDKSGFALLLYPLQNDTLQEALSLESLSFPALIEAALQARSIADRENLRFVVAVEAGWLNRSNWHTKPGDSHRKAAAIGRAAGRNHEVGKKIIEMLRYKAVEVEEVKPLIKRWQGAGGKISAKEFEELTGYSRRTSQDMRDAGLIAMAYANMPLAYGYKSYKEKSR